MLPEVISRMILKYYKFLLFVILCITYFFGYNAFLSERKIITDFSLEQLFPDKDPDKDIYEQLQKDFPKEESNLFIVYECDNCLSQNSLNQLLNITEDLSFIEGVEEVNSILSFIDQDYDDYSKNEWKEESKDIIKNPALENVFIARNGEINNIIVKLENYVDDHDSRKPILNQVYKVLDGYNIEYIWLVFHL